MGRSATAGLRTMGVRGALAPSPSPPGIGRWGNRMLPQRPILLGGFRRQHCPYLALSRSRNALRRVRNVGVVLLKRSNSYYRQIVDRIETVARADAGEPLRIADLCRVASVNGPTLRRAFRTGRGISPCRHLRAYRLTQARHALLSADVERGAVTQIAMRFGFLELGRFAVDYRSIFGECPSATLRRSREQPWCSSVPLCKS